MTPILQIYSQTFIGTEVKQQFHNPDMAAGDANACAQRIRDVPPLLHNEDVRTYFAQPEQFHFC